MIKNKYKDRDWLYNKYWIEKKSLRQIAKEFKPKNPKINYWIKKLNIPTRSISKAINIQNKKYHNKKWLYDQYINKKKSCEKIGKEINTTPNTIHNWLKRFNIERRDKSKAQKIGQNNTETKIKKSIPMRKEKNHNWKGGNYLTKHKYIKDHKMKPERCEICGKKTDKLDVSFDYLHKGKNPIYYTFNPDDYTYRCNSCHQKYDNIINKEILI